MDALQQMSAVVCVFGLLGAVLLWMRKKHLIRFDGSGRKDAQPALSVLQRVRLTPQHSLVIVRAGEKEFVLALHASGCTLVDLREAKQL
jgi:flagellar biogenesis protein FliO